MDILFQNKDQKFSHWNAELRQLGIESDAVAGSAIKAPFFLIKFLLKPKNRRAKVYVFRYLNDYSSLWKSLLRFFSEVTVVVLCHFFNVKIWWICHNIDRESAHHYVELTKLRRWLVKKNSSRIFTTNKLLTPFAVKELDYSNISNISLGVIEESVYENMESSENMDGVIENWLLLQKEKGNRILFCAGSEAEKSLHFLRIRSFLEEVNGNNELPNFSALVVGVAIIGSESIFNIPYRYEVKKEHVEKFVDYYYRVVSDLSIPYSLYEAAHREKPIITEKYGILPEIVEYYGMGITYSTSNDILRLENENFNFKFFLKENNWKVTAIHLKSCFLEDVF